MASWYVPETMWVDAGIAALGVAGMLAILSVWWPGLRAIALGRVLPLAVVLLMVGITLRWRASGQGPFLTLFEVVLSNLFTLGLFYFAACALVPRVRASAATALPMLALLGIWALTLPRDVMPLPPTFDNLWLWAHVLAGKLFLGACLVSTALALRLLLRPSGHEAAEKLSRELEPAIWQFAALAFVFDSLMLVAGAAWANDAWGRYWTWDPLETWAFLTWLCLAILLHARLAWRIPGKLGWLGICTVFVLAFLTFFGVPFFSIAPHKGLL